MERTRGEQPGRTIQAVEIAFSIIDFLQEHERPGVTEIADALGYSKSTVHSHLRTLEGQEIIVRENDGYRLSLRMLDMATQVREQVGNYQVIKQEVDELAEETSELSQFGIEEHGQVSYLYKSTGGRAVQTASRVGTRQPMYATSLGKTILAFTSPDRREEIVASMDFEPLTSNTITSPDKLEDELEAIRDRGYGIDDEENFAGLRCISAPVRNADSVLGAVSITGPSSRFTDERLHGELSDYVQQAANVIELNTKFG